MTQRQVNSDLDDILEVLGSSYRRGILYELEDAETDAVLFDELVDSVAEYPAATDQEEVTAILHHAHLPKLDDIGWIEYEPRSETVRYRPEAVPTEILSFLRTAESPSEP
jgi:hypothetical protein